MCSTFCNIIFLSFSQEKVQHNISVIAEILILLHLTIRQCLAVFLFSKVHKVYSQASQVGQALLILHRQKVHIMYNIHISEQ